jgi:hypothetical protein
MVERMMVRVNASTLLTDDDKREIAAFAAFLNNPRETGWWPLAPFACCRPCGV